MAKTTSQIIAENKERNEKIQQVVDYSKSVDEAMQEIRNNRNEAEQIRQEAIAAGTWGTKKSSSDETIHETAIVSGPMPDNAFTVSSIAYGVGGFFLGALVMFLFFKIKIKRIQKECETRINEARASLDRMLIIASREQKT